MGEAVRVSIDASSVNYEIAKANFAGTRWEVNLSGIRVEAPTPSTALGVIAQALCKSDPYALAPAYDKGGETLLRSPEELRKQLEAMAAARMSPEWIAGALWASSWMRGEVD